MLFLFCFSFSFLFLFFPFSFAPSFGNAGVVVATHELCEIRLLLEVNIVAILVDSVPNALLRSITR